MLIGMDGAAPKEKCIGGTIVCGIADSDGGRSAAELGAALSARLALRLVLVHVVEAGSPEHRGDPTPAVERIATSFARDVERAETRVVIGARADALAQVAAEEGADLIVLGSRSSGLGRRHLRCVLAQELEAATSVPVLVAPPSTRIRSSHRLALVQDVVTR